MQVIPPNQDFTLLNNLRNIRYNNYCELISQLICELSTIAAVCLYTVICINYKPTVRYIASYSSLVLISSELLLVNLEIMQLMWHLHFVTQPIVFRQVSECRLPQKLIDYCFRPFYVHCNNNEKLHSILETKHVSI